ncbi:MAG: hypothetical protein NC485_01465 [Ruminococcus flavefaciens]|nr:hypothetical protein [Ruminococcus flavefaciens]MCM1061660.1 hypothetical protein [Eubacterium sp.]
MKNYDELAERVLRKAEERIVKRNIRMTRLRRTSIAVSGMFAVILVMFGIWKNDSIKNALNDDFNNKNFITENYNQQNLTTSAAYITSSAEGILITRTTQSDSSVTQTQPSANITVSVPQSSSLQTVQTVSSEALSGTTESSSTVKTQTSTNTNGTTGTSVSYTTSSAAAVSSTTETGAVPTETTSSRMPSVITTATSSASATTSKTSTTKTSASTTTSVRTSSRTSTTTTTIRTTIWASESISSSATTTARPYQPPIVTDENGNTPVYIEYPNLVIQGESLRPWGTYEPTTEYTGVSGDLAENRIGEYIGTVELTDKTGNTSISAEVYKVTEMSPLVCVAVKAKGRSGYSLYRNRYYTPVTLGDMINDMNLLEEAVVTSIEWTNADEGWIREVYLGKETVFEKLFTDHNIINGADLEYKLAIFTIYIDIPLLNKKNDVIFLSDNGYMSTTIVDFNAYFSIDKINVDSLINYILQNGLYTESPVDLE